MENTILNEQDSNMLANSINHFKSIEHQEILFNIQSEYEMRFVKTYNLIPFKDGNQWCVLLGENIQEGICGIGETPIKAILEFNKSFTSK